MLTGNKYTIGNKHEESVESYSQLSKRSEEDKQLTQRSEVSVVHEKSKTGIKTGEESKGNYLNQKVGKALNDTKECMTEKDYALIEKLFKVQDDSTTLTKNEIDTIRELLLCICYIKFRCY